MASLKILSAVFLLMNASGIAQTMVGVQGGMNWSNYDARPTPGNVFGTGSGHSFGILTQFKIGNDLYLIANLAYVEKTIPWLVHENIKSTAPDIEFQYEFTQLSASVKKEFPIYHLRPYIIAGGTYGFLNSGSVIDSRFGGPAYIMDWTNNYKSSDLDLNLGLGLSYDLAETVLIFTDLKYSYDLISLNKNTAGYIYIRSIQGSCGVLFAI